MALSTRPLACLATLLLALAVYTAGCGSDSSKKTTASTTTAPATPAVASTTPKTITGKYTAQLTSDGLKAAGVDYVNVGGGGLWHLTVTKDKLSMTPPPPAHDPTKYAIVSAKAGRLTLAPNKDCSTTEGKTQKSTFTFSESSAGLQFKAVKVACKEDGGSLAVAPWHKQ
ncbi:MAG: hypothetical protein QOE08_1874 [Thermoleophilaceae bacterium]|nr:hypothetical protein [Thermoleophilaceae bacterium]